ncbi:MAG: LapA family protein [Gammaproteobacteria bacterium]|nr:LapA family protein [Gammaproteobacteria bacterium]
MKRILYLIIIFFIAMFTISFTLLNSQSVTISYYFGNSEVDLLVVLIVCFTLGALLGVFSVLGKVFSLKHEIIKKEKEIKIAEKEVENLRALPFKDEP